MLLVFSLLSSRSMYLPVSDSSRQIRCGELMEIYARSLHESCSAVYGYAASVAEEKSQRNAMYRQ